MRRGAARAHARACARVRGAPVMQSAVPDASVVVCAPRHAAVVPGVAAVGAQAVDTRQHQQIVVSLGEPGRPFR